MKAGDRHPRARPQGRAALRPHDQGLADRGPRKEQITGRMPHNLKTLEYLRKQNIADFGTIHLERRHDDDRETARQHAGPAPPQDGHAARRVVAAHAAVQPSMKRLDADLLPHDRARAADREPQEAQVGPRRTGQPAERAARPDDDDARNPGQPPAAGSNRSRRASPSTNRPCASCRAATCGWWCRSPRSTATAACASST